MISCVTSPLAGWAHPPVLIRLALESYRRWYPLQDCSWKRCHPAGCVSLSRIFCGYFHTTCLLLSISRRTCLSDPLRLVLLPSPGCPLQHHSSDRLHVFNTVHKPKIYTDGTICWGMLSTSLVEELATVDEAFHDQKWVAAMDAEL